MLGNKIISLAKTIGGTVGAGIEFVTSKINKVKTRIERATAEGYAKEVNKETKQT